MKNKKLFWLVYHIGILVLSIISAMIMKYNQTGEAIVPETILVTVTIFSMSALGGYLGVYIFNRLAKLSHKELNKKIVPAFFLFLVAIIIIANIVISIGVYIWYIVKGIDLSTFLSNLYRLELYPANKNLSTWLVLISLVFFYSLWKKSSRKEQMLREENLKYKYRNLKSQVNPHFLFNSLNTLSELVYVDAKKADIYIQKLSGIYRYILENEETDLISLNEELEFIRQYFNLQKVRDNDKIILNIDVQEEEEFKIIPVSLQLLVENALKHNSISREKPLVVKIFSSDDYIIVSNTIQRKNILENSTQVGLSNLKKRVRLIMGRELIINEDTNQFVVKLPIIRLPK
jgi:two-component system, LytTR family, sensor kinase